jgi:hypothetical protein
VNLEAAGCKLRKVQFSPGDSALIPAVIPQEMAKLAGRIPHSQTPICGVKFPSFKLANTTLSPDYFFAKHLIVDLGSPASQRFGDVVLYHQKQSTSTQSAFYQGRNTNR